MKIKNILSEEYLSKPYLDEAESFSRHSLADQLTKLYGNLDHGTVAVLQGRWGVGKTTFVKKWIAGLKENGFEAIYFSAFENDYLDDPFMALNASILNHLKQNGSSDESKSKKFKTAAVAGSKKLAIAGAKVGVKALTLGALSLDDLDIESAIAEGASDLAEQAMAKILEEHAAAEKTFKEFRSNLSELVASSGSLAQENHGKFIFVVDELDRCRPDFALRLIEILKHFFDADGLHFVLVANREFLTKSICHRYGLNEDSEAYLDKFFDFSIFFEQPPSQRHVVNSRQYTAHVISLLIKGDNINDIKNDIAEISEVFDLTYRQIDKIATNAAIAYSTIRENEFRPTDLIAFLCFLKSVHPRIFVQVKQSRMSFLEIKNILNSGQWVRDNSKQRWINKLRYFTDKDIDENSEEFSGYSRSLWHYNFSSRLDVLPILANFIIDRFGR